MVRQAELDIVIRGDETDLRRATSRANASLSQVGRGTATIGRTIDRNLGRSSGANRAIQNMSFQLGDFATQVGAGTSASIALGQQLPQLLGGFGVLGAVLGAVVAIGVPLVRVMSDLSTQGRDMTSVFGELQPLAQAVGNAFIYMRETLVGALELVINNLDRLLITGGLVAGFFTAKWVAAFVAARLATFSLATALTFLRGALIRTGIGAVVVAIGEAIYQFTRLARAAGGVGEAFVLLGGVAKEVFQRIGVAWDYVVATFAQGAASFEAAFLTAIQSVLQAFQDLTWSVAEGFNTLFGTNMQGVSIGALDGVGTGTLAQAISSATHRGANAGYQREGLAGQLNAPLESVQKIKDLLASIKDERITLPDLLGVGAGEDGEEGGGGGKSAAEKLDEELSAQEQRIKEHFDRIKALTVGGLSDKLGAWGNYFNNLVSLTGTNNKKLLAIGKAFSAAQSLVDAWSAYTQVLRDPAFIGRPWARVAAAAQVLAAGIGAVNAIKSIGDNGSGPTTPAGAAGASAATAPAPAAQKDPGTYLNFTFTGGMSSPEDVGRFIVESINKAVENGAVIRGVRMA